MFYLVLIAVVAVGTLIVVVILRQIQHLISKKVLDPIGKSIDAKDARTHQIYDSLRAQHPGQALFLCGDIRKRMKGHEGVETLVDVSTMVDVIDGGDPPPPWVFNESQERETYITYKNAYQLEGVSTVDIKSGMQLRGYDFEGTVRGVYKMDDYNCYGSGNLPNNSGKDVYILVESTDSNNDQLKQAIKSNTAVALYLSPTIPSPT